MTPQGMTDTYYSRMLAFARQNKDRNIRFIKNIEEDRIEVEFDDGSAKWLPWEEAISYGDYDKNKDSSRNKETN